MPSVTNSRHWTSWSRTPRPARAGSGVPDIGAEVGRGILRVPFRDRDSTHQRGRRAEAIGRRWLVARGYRVLESNYRTKVGEIDVVGREGDVLCFVEIKARASSAYGSAISAVGARQRSRVARAAALYLQREGWEGACRFDVLAMDWAGGEWRFELLRGAFELS